MKKLLHHFLEHSCVCLITAIIVGLLAFAGLNIKFLNPVARAVKEFALSDIYYQMAWSGDDKPETSEMITLVDISRLHQRGDIAKVIEQVNACEPAVIGIDIIFEGEKDDAQGNMMLEDAIIGAQETVIAQKLTDWKQADKSFHGRVRSYFTRDIPIMEGYSNVDGDITSQCLRKLTVERNLDGKPVLSLAAQCAVLYNDGSIPPDKRADRLINYRHIDFPVIDPDSVTARPELIKGRIVLIGTITEEQDMHFTPLGKMPGMKVQAYSIQSLLEQHNIYIASEGWQIALAIVVCWLTAYLQFHVLHFIRRRKSLFGMFLSNSNLFMRFFTFGWLGLLTWLSFISYARYNLYVPMGIVLMPVILVAEGRAIYGAIVKNNLTNNPDGFFRNSIYRDAKSTPANEPVPETGNDTADTDGTN